MIIPALVLCFSSLWYFNSKYSQIESRIKKKNNYRGKDYYILFFSTVPLKWTNRSLKSLK